MGIRSPPSSDYRYSVVPSDKGKIEPGEMRHVALNVSRTAVTTIKGVIFDDGALSGEANSLEPAIALGRSSFVYSHTG